MSDARPAPDATRLQQLIDAIIEGAATEQSMLELESLLHSSRENRRFYRRAMGLYADLRWIHRSGVDGGSYLPTEAIAAEGSSIGAAPIGSDAPVLGDASDSTLPDGTGTIDTASFGAAPSGGIPAVDGMSFSRSSLGRRAVLPIWAFAKRVSNVGGLGLVRGAAALLVVGLILSLIAINRYYEKFPAVDRLANSAIPVAELRLDHECVWAGAQSVIPLGSQLVSGERMELLQGKAKLGFAGGATVLVESPSVFRLLTASAMHLEQGTVAVRAGPDKDFTVVSPDAQIVDLGTSFGVHRGATGATEVEVFEGAVEVYPDGESNRSRVLGIGASARVRGNAGKPRVDMVASAVDRFGDLLELLWEDMVIDSPDNPGDQDSPVIEASFVDGPVPGAIDTFYGAGRGRGWRTPWVATGNPIGEIVEEDPLIDSGSPYLRLRFGRAYDRCVARQYGERPGFDPNQPHVISWRWRFDGNPDHFVGEFNDRIYFYGNPFFRRNSWPTNTWLLGVVGGNERVKSRHSPIACREVYPQKWFVFDGQDGEYGAEFDRRNMIDTGLELKAGVVYRFVVIVYPEQQKYDVAIRDDEQTYTRAGLSFRNRSGEPGSVVHFGCSSNSNRDDSRFSLGSIRIEPLCELTAIREKTARHQRGPAVGEQVGQMVGTSDEVAVNGGNEACECDAGSAWSSGANLNCHLSAAIAEFQNEQFGEPMEALGAEHWDEATRVISGVGAMSDEMAIEESAAEAATVGASGVGR